MINILKVTVRLMDNTEEVYSAETEIGKERRVKYPQVLYSGSWLVVINAQGIQKAYPDHRVKHVVVIN